MNKKVYSKFIVVTIIIILCSILEIKANADEVLGIIEANNSNISLQNNIEQSNIDLSKLKPGTYEIEYIVTDNDGNRVVQKRKVTILPKDEVVEADDNSNNYKVTINELFNSGNETEDKDNYLQEDDSYLDTKEKKYVLEKVFSGAYFTEDNKCNNIILILIILIIFILILLIIKKRIFNKKS